MDTNTEIVVDRPPWHSTPEKLTVNGETRYEIDVYTVPRYHLTVVETRPVRDLHHEAYYPDEPKGKLTRTGYRAVDRNGTTWYCAWDGWSSDGAMPWQPATEPHEYLYEVARGDDMHLHYFRVGGRAYKIVSQDQLPDMLDPPRIMI